MRTGKADLLSARRWFLLAATAMLLILAWVVGFARPVKAEDTGLRLYCYVGDQEGKTDIANWGFNVWNGSKAVITEQGTEDVEIDGWGRAIPSLVPDSAHEGWGYIGLSCGDLSGFQLVYTDGVELCRDWVKTIGRLNLSEAYLKGGRWYYDRACTASIPSLSDEVMLQSYKLYFRLPGNTSAADWGVNIWGSNCFVGKGNRDVTVSPAGWRDGNFPTLLEDTDKPGWGYVIVYGEYVTDIQFANADAVYYQCWRQEIARMSMSEAYYDSTALRWYQDEACTKPLLDDTGISEADQTKVKLYYYITDSAMDCSDYGVNVAGESFMTEAGSYMEVDAWGYQIFRKLLDAQKENTVEGIPGKWGYIGLSLYPNTLQFVTEAGGDNVWDSQIASQNLTEAYYVPGYGWFRDSAARISLDGTNCYWVTFKADQITLGKVLVQEGHAAVAPQIIEKTGWTFAGWDTAYDCVSEDMTVNAQWTANRYQLHYQVNGGSKMKTTDKMVVYGSAYGTLPTPKRTGYRFLGWYTEKTGGKKITAKSRVAITEDTSLYAHWKKVSRPARVKSVKVRNSAGKTMKVTYAKVSAADGYEIRYGTKSNMKGAKKRTVTKTKVTVKNLRKGKTYYVQVRAYKLDSAGKKVYSKSYSRKVKVVIQK